MRVCQSGLMGRIANPLFTGSNPVTRSIFAEVAQCGRAVAL